VVHGPETALAVEVFDGQGHPVDELVTFPPPIFYGGIFAFGNKYDPDWVDPKW